MLCDHIVAVNPPMYDELAKWHNSGKESPQIYGIGDISKWNYILPGDQDDDVPEGLKLYRIWRGGDVKKGGKIRTIDFTEARGSGMPLEAMKPAVSAKLVNLAGRAFTNTAAISTRPRKSNSFEAVMGIRSPQGQWSRDGHPREQLFIKNSYKNS